jgi:ribonuclease I
VLIDVFGQGNVKGFNVACQQDESGVSYLETLIVCLDLNYQPYDCPPSTNPPSCSAKGIVYQPLPAVPNTSGSNSYSSEYPRLFKRVQPN